MALGLITVSASPAEAAWNNVFQVTCWNCRSHSSSSSYYLAPSPVYSGYSPAYSAYSAPAANGCCDPCQQCTTKYVQRCYYQPVTCYQTQTYYEPVTTYTTKTYYEPVTTYRYSCYYDPCSCRYQQVATPCTSYVARQQCCPVQSWVQRCAQVPVTTYRQSFYWEPQTTCCSTTAGPAPCAVAPPVVGGQQTPPPVVGGQQTPPPPVVDGKTGPGNYNEYYNNPKDQQQSQSRQIAPNGGKVQVPVTPSPTLPANAKLDKIASSNGSMVQGQIVNDANAPRAGVQVIFVSAKRQAPEQTVTTNSTGRFEVDLPQGEWLVYVRSTDGQQVYHSRIDVGAKQKAPIVLVSR